MSKFGGKLKPSIKFRLGLRYKTNEILVIKAVLWILKNDLDHPQTRSRKQTTTGR
jgi:hypothetical protein